MKAIAAMKLGTGWFFLSSSVLVLADGVIAEVTSADPISGGAGWVGAGLLGLVLGWLLLVHLPAKDKQLDAKDKQLLAQLDIKDKQQDGLVQSFAKSLAAAQESFLARNDKTLEVFTVTIAEEREAQQVRHEENRNRIEQVISDLKEQRHYLANLANQLHLRKAVEDAQAKLKPPESD